jgi:hypothetical protein
LPKWKSEPGGEASDWKPSDIGSKLIQLKRDRQDGKISKEHFDAEMALVNAEVEKTAKSERAWEEKAREEREAEHAKVYLAGREVKTDA